VAGPDERYWEIMNECVRTRDAYNARMNPETRAAWSKAETALWEYGKNACGMLNGELVLSLSGTYRGADYANRIHCSQKCSRNP
jgi:hypothetical protein